MKTVRDIVDKCNSLTDDISEFTHVINGMKTSVLGPTGVGPKEVLIEKRQQMQEELDKLLDTEIKSL